MADTKKPIDTLKTKTAAQLDPTDYFLGHDAGSPAGFRAPIGELITRIIGPVETNADGSFVRLENGWQVCWRTASQTLSNQAVRTSSFVWPAAFVDDTYVPLITLDRSDPTLLVSAYGRQPTFVQWAARTRDGANFTGAVSVFAFAVGRWK